MLAAAGLTSEEVADLVWPDRCALDADPQCRFALKHDRFVVLVEGGTAVTVLPGADYRASHLRASAAPLVHEVTA
jgi:hypothetical protein